MSSQVGKDIELDADLDSDVIPSVASSKFEPYLTARLRLYACRRSALFVTKKTVTVPDQSLSWLLKLRQT